MLNRCLLLLLPFTGLAQTKYEIGIEANITNCKYRIADNGRNLKPSPALSGMGGIVFRINTRKRFFYEAALLATEYAEGVMFQQANGSGYINSDVALLLALRAGYYVRLSSKFSVVPCIGIAPGAIVMSQNGNYSSSVSLSGGNTYGYEFRPRNLSNRLLLLLQGGIGLDYKLARRVRLMFSSAYYLGLRTTKVFDIRYSINNAPLQTAAMYGKGSMWCYGFSVGYLFDRL